MREGTTPRASFSTLQWYRTQRIYFFQAYMTTLFGKK